MEETISSNYAIEQVLIAGLAPNISASSLAECECLIAGPPGQPRYGEANFDILCLLQIIT